MTIQAVIQSLRSLDDLHQTLLELGEHKQQVIINNQVDELAQITNKESKLLKQVGELEKSWLDAMASFLQEKGLAPNPSLKMSELIQLVYDAKDKEALITAQQSLLQTMDQLQSINSLNQQLIEQSLSFIDYTLDLVTDNPDDLIGYQNPNAKGKSTQKTTIFDTKA